MSQYEQLALRLLHHIARTLEEKLEGDEGSLGPSGEDAKLRRKEFNKLTQEIRTALEIK